MERQLSAKKTLNTLDPKLKEMENVQMKSKGGQPWPQDSLRKWKKIWKGQDKQTKLKILRACIFPTAYMGAKDGP